MHSRIINEAGEGAQRSFVLIFAPGDEVVTGLTAFAREHEITAAEFRGIGALSDAVLGYFDWESKSYKRIPVGQQVEVVSLLGNVALGPDDKPSIHPHIVVAGPDGVARGGHLMEAHVRPTLEIVVTESPTYLQRRKDRTTGLALIRV